MPSVKFLVLIVLHVEYFKLFISINIYISFIKINFFTKFDYNNNYLILYKIFNKFYTLITNRFNKHNLFFYI